MDPQSPIRAELLSELQNLCYYWREISEAKSDPELVREVARLKSDRHTIKGIFNYKILGPDLP